MTVAIGIHAARERTTLLFVVDEFDNLSSNGYWGLALGTDNLYRLTFTQEAAKTAVNSVTTELGSQRLASTDYSAGAGVAVRVSRQRPVPFPAPRRSDVPPSPSV